MKNNYDEPVFNEVQTGSEEEAEKSLKDIIGALCKSQPFAVLSTMGKKEPDASLVAFAASDDLRYIVFATPKNTSKYSNIEALGQVALLADNRSSQPGSINQIFALTVKGTASILTKVPEIDSWSRVLTLKHPYLTNFVNTPSTAIVLIKVDNYSYVRRFQEIFVWSPDQI